MIRRLSLFEAFSPCLVIEPDLAHVSLEQDVKNSGHKLTKCLRNKEDDCQPQNKRPND